MNYELYTRIYRKDAEDAEQNWQKALTVNLEFN